MDDFSEKRRRLAAGRDRRKKARIRSGIDSIVVTDHSGRRVVGLRLVARRPQGGFRQAVEYRGVVADDPDIYTASSHDSAMLWEARRMLLNLAETQPTSRAASSGQQFGGAGRSSH